MGADPVASAAKRMRTTTCLDPKELRRTVAHSLYVVGDIDLAATYNIHPTDDGSVMGDFEEVWPGRDEGFCAFVKRQPGPFLGWRALSRGSRKERSAFLEDSALMPRHVYESHPSIEKYLAPVGIAYSQRLLVFHGQRFVAHVGLARTTHTRPLTRRNRQRLQPLVEPVQAALILADSLERKDTPQGPAPLVVRADGRVEHASSTGREWLARDGFAEALAARVRAFDRGDQPEPSDVLERAQLKLIRLDGSDGIRYLVELVPARDLVISPVDALTERQRQVAELAAAGATLAEVAQELGISRETAKEYLAHVYRELEVANRVELARALERREG